MKLNKFCLKSIVILVCAILFIGNPSCLFAYMYQKDEQPGFILPRSYTLDNAFSPVNALQIPDFSKKFKEEREKLAALILQALIMPVQSGPEDEIQALITQLGDEKWEVREEAQKKLIEMGEKCVPQLKEALNNKDLEIAIRAKQILEKINPDSKGNKEKFALPGFDNPDEITKTLEKYKGSRDKSLIPIYITLLEKAPLDLKQRYAIINEIKEFGPEAAPAVETISKSLRDWKLNMVVVNALARIGTKEAAEAFLKGLDLCNASESYIVLQTLTGFQNLKAGEDIKGADALVRFLKSKEERTALLAIRVIGIVGYRAAQKELVILMGNEHNKNIRLESVKTLGNLKAKESADALFSMIDDQQIGIEAAFALGEIGDERAFQVLLDIVQNKGENVLNRAKAAALLCKIDGKKADPILYSLLKDESRIVRRAAAEGLSHLRDYNQLNQMLKDKDPDIRMAGILAVTYKGELNAIDELVLLLKNDENPQVRFCIAYNLGALAKNKILEDKTKSKIVSALSEAAQKDKDPAVQKSAQEALAKIK